MSPYEFRLENTAYDTRVEGAIYRERADGDLNTLVLTLRNTSAGPFTLLGGTMPESSDSVGESPTTLFLTFGNKDLSDALTLDALGVEISTDGTSWTSVSDPHAGWSCAHFKARRENLPPYIGLCPKQNVDLAAKASVQFRLTRLGCTYAGLSSQRLQIGCYNLAGSNRDSHLPLNVIDPPTYLKALSEVLTPRLTSRTLPRDWSTGDAEVLITPDAVQAASGRRLDNELKLTLAYTGLESGVDLSGASFIVTFVAGDKDDTGALTTAGDISNITGQAPEGWQPRKQDGNESTPASWVIGPLDHGKLANQKSVDVVFKNLEIGEGFPAGVTYVSLINRNVKGYRDSHFPLPVNRSLAKASIAEFRVSQTDRPDRASTLLGGADELVTFNGTVYLTWKAFAVPYLQLEYQTLDDAANVTTRYVEYRTLDGDGTLSCASFPLANMKADTGFTLRGYSTPPGTKRVEDHAPLVQASSDTGVRVHHTSPLIDAFRATCSPTEALLQWSVSFGEMDSWLNVEIEDANGVRLYEPKPAERKNGQCSLKPAGTPFDEHTTFKLKAWNSKLDQEKPTKDVGLGAGLDLIKSFTATPHSPLVLGATPATLQWEVLFDDLGEVAIAQDGVRKAAPGGAAQKTGPMTVENVTTATKLKIYAKRKDGAEVSLDADVKQESVEAFILRMGKAGAWAVMRVKTSGIYEFLLSETLYFFPDHVEYHLGVDAFDTDAGTHRPPADVKYESRGKLTLDQSDGHYYVEFGAEPERRFAGQIRYPVEFYHSAASGQYWVPSLPAWKFRLEPTGVQGARVWSPGITLQFGEDGWAGWYSCEPKDGAPSFLQFGGT